MGDEPVIFLDIDGVICCNYNGHLEEPKLAQLKRIVEETGAKVVLSTDWRRQPPLKKQLHTVLGRLGIDVIGATPMRAMYQPIRPQEITAWWGKSGRTGPWVAIDDRDLTHEIGGAALQGHFVRTHPAAGLTPANADKAIRILRGRSSTPDSPINKPDSADSIADTIPQPRTPGAGRAMTPSRGGGATPPRWSRSNNDYGAFAAQASTPVTRALGPRGSNVGRPNTAFAPSPAGLSLGAGSPLRRSGTAAAPPLSIWTGQQPRSPTKPSYGAGFSRTPSKDITQGRWRSESVWGSSPMRR